MRQLANFAFRAFPVLLLASVGAVTGNAEQRPKALEELVACRDALRTGHVELSITDYARAARKEREVHTSFRTVRFADDRHIHIHRGDEEGVVTRTPEGAPHPHDTGLPRYRFEAPGDAWIRRGGSLTQNLLLHRPRQVRDDVRTLGAAPYMANFDMHDLIWRENVRNPVAKSFEESREDDLHVARVQTSTGTTTYWLDSQRGWSPVRVRDDYESGGWAESRSALKLMDGVWFPTAVEMYSSRYKDGKEPAMVVRVYSATFNRPEHPQELTPADIGLEVGMDAQVVDQDTRSRRGKWDGERVVSDEEFLQRLRRGELQEGPGFLRGIAKAQTKLAQDRKTQGAVAGPAEATATAYSSLQQAADAARRQPEKFESLWETYVRRFIQKYQLNDDQTQKAMSILKDCQAQAQSYMTRHKGDFEELDRRAAKLKEKGEAESSASWSALKKQKAKLLKPIGDIFERRLKPRLDKLPTRAQRASAGPATQPAAKAKKDG